TFFSEYYSKNIHIENYKTFDEISEHIFYQNIPKLIIDVSENPENINYIFELLPINVKLLIIKAFILSIDLDINTHKDFRNKIKEYFKNDITKIKNTWYITYDNNVICKESDVKEEDVNILLSQFEKCSDKELNVLQTN